MRLALAPLLIAAALGIASAADPKVDGKKLKVEIAKAKVTVNGKALPIPGELADFEKAFGKPSGTVKDPVSDKNQYVYWNALGIRCSQSTKGKQPIQDVRFYFDATYDLSAKAQTKPFLGEVVIEGQAITKASTKADMKKLKLGREVLGTWQIDYVESPLSVNIDSNDKGTKSVSSEQPPIDRKD